MLFYTINNLLILLWAAVFCFHKPSKKKNLVFIVLAFTQLGIISILRYHIGFDYNMYAVGFNFMNEDGFAVMSYKDWEIGFVFLTKLLAIFLPDFIWYIGFFVIVALVPTAIFIYKNSDMPWVSTVLYVNLFLFFMTMNFLRQAAALSIIMLSWHFMKKNKIIPFIITVIAASLFHQTALVMIVVYFLVKMKSGIKEIIFYLYLLLWFYISSTGFINLITSFVHEEYSDSAFVREGLSFVYALLPIAVVVIAFFLVQINTIVVDREVQYIINMSLIYAILSVTMLRHSIIERLTYYFAIFLIILVPIIYQSIRYNGIKFSLGSDRMVEISTEKQKKIVAAVVLCVILAISYSAFYYGISENAHGVVPYDTWL
ncbi:MAG: EpsG family protein [Acutalibacteraceae bacterium]